MERHYIRNPLFSLLDTKMGMPPNWFTKVTRKIRRSSSRDIVVLHSNSIKCEDEEKSGAAAGETVKHERINSKSTQCSTRELTKEDTSAVKIQSAFRAHLARRAFRALRSLVKLQALVRGAYVRKQTRMAYHCMHSLVRLQVRIRARQLLSRYGNDD